MQYSAIKNKRLLAMLFLGFFSGLPLALSGSTLQAWFTESNVSMVGVGALTLVGMPYVWKFLWAPFMDRFVPPFLGRRRGWICVTQLALCFALLFLAFQHPSVNPFTMGFLALVISFFSASQDIVMDAYRTDVLHPEERGLGAAIFIFAYRIAMLVSGGLVLILADHLGFKLAYEIMAGLFALSLISTVLSPEISALIPHPRSIREAVVEPFMNLWARDGILLMLLFVVFYKIGDAFAQSLMSAFLLKGLGFSLTEVGVAFKSVSLIATILGAFVGGSFLMRINLYRSLLWFGILQAASTGMFLVLALVGKNFSFMVVSLFVDNFCGGMSTAAFIAFLMSLCDKRYSATQYACLSALSAIGRVFLGPLAGMVVQQAGWVQFYAWSIVLSIPGIILLLMLRMRIKYAAEEVMA